jgi:hypothetical protein
MTSQREDAGPLPSPDQLIGSAAKFLIEGGEEEAASVLLSCRCEDMWAGRPDYGGDRVVYSLWVELRGPRSAYDILSNRDGAIYQQVHKAIGAVLSVAYWLEPLTIRAELITVEPNWHAELLEMARGTSIHNQAAPAKNPQIWQGLRFRSRTEIKIAEALDQAGVLFFPLGMARLNAPGGRVNREPDFLICKDGKWGILEVDGEPYHPPQRTVHDHERDRLFHNHGVRLIQHYDSTDCYTTPKKVVGEFLRLLEKA